MAFPSARIKLVFFPKAALWEAYPLAGQRGGELGNHRGRRGLKAIVLERRGDEVQHRHQARLTGESLAAGEGFDPADAPAEPLHQLPHCGFRTPFQFQRHRAAELIVDEDRVGDSNGVLAARDPLHPQHGDAPFRHTAFHSRRQLRAALDAFGPQRHRRESARFRGAQNHHAAHHAVEHAALDVEPGGGEAFRVGGMTEPRPEFGFEKFGFRIARRAPRVADGRDAVVFRHALTSFRFE
jgi:hypothetical protein